MSLRGATLGAIPTFLCAVTLVPAVFAQANYLKPAMVRITDLNNQRGGSGFVFRLNEKEQIAYLLTNEHVIRGLQKVNVQFFSADGKAVEVTVVRQDKGKDLAVVQVTGRSNIPNDVIAIEFGQATALMPGDSVEVLSYSSADEEWSVTSGTVEALRPEVVEEGGSETVHAIRFSAFVRAGDSGSPLIMRLRVFGIVESAPLPGSDTDSPRAIQVATIQDFLKELLPEPDPNPVWLPQPKPSPKPSIRVDREAQACAISFLDLMIHDQLGNHRSPSPPSWRHTVSSL
jgi:S1-C subfamily serine protease